MDSRNVTAESLYENHRPSTSASYLELEDGSDAIKEQHYDFPRASRVNEYFEIVTDEKVLEPSVLIAPEDNVYDKVSPVPVLVENQRKPVGVTTPDPSGSVDISVCPQSEQVLQADLLLTNDNYVNFEYDNVSFAKVSDLESDSNNKNTKLSTSKPDSNNLTCKAMNKITVVSHDVEHKSEHKSESSSGARLSSNFVATCEDKENPLEASRPVLVSTTAADTEEMTLMTFRPLSGNVDPTDKRNPSVSLRPRSSNSVPESEDTPIRTSRQISVNDADQDTGNKSNGSHLNTDRKESETKSKTESKTEDANCGSVALPLTDEKYLEVNAENLTGKDSQIKPEHKMDADNSISKTGSIVEKALKNKTGEKSEDETKLVEDTSGKDRKVARSTSFSKRALMKITGKKEEEAEDKEEGTLEMIDKAHGTLYLKKKRLFSPWRKFFFVLDGSQLTYYSSRQQYCRLTGCRGSVDLTLLNGVTQKKPTFFCRTYYPLLLERRSLSALYLGAETAEEQERWHELLQRALETRKAASRKVSQVKAAALSASPDVVSSTLPTPKKKKKRSGSLTSSFSLRRKSKEKNLLNEEDEKSEDEESNEKSPENISKETHDKTQEEEEVLIKPKKIVKAGIPLITHDLNAVRLKKAKIDTSKSAQDTSDATAATDEKFGVHLKKTNLKEKLLDETASRHDQVQENPTEEVGHDFRSLLRSRRISTTGVDTGLYVKYGGGSPDKDNTKKRRSPSPNLPLSKSLKAVLDKSTEECNLVTDDHGKKVVITKPQNESEDEVHEAVEIIDLNNGKLCPVNHAVAENIRYSDPPNELESLGNRSSGCAEAYIEENRERRGSAAPSPVIVDLVDTGASHFHPRSCLEIRTPTPLKKDKNKITEDPELEAPSTLKINDEKGAASKSETEVHDEDEGNGSILSCEMIESKPVQANADDENTEDSLDEIASRKVSLLSNIFLSSGPVDIDESSLTPSQSDGEFVVVCKISEGANYSNKNVSSSKSENGEITVNAYNLILDNESSMSLSPLPSPKIIQEQRFVQSLDSLNAFVRDNEASEEQIVYTEMPSTTNQIDSSEGSAHKVEDYIETEIEGESLQKVDTDDGSNEHNLIKNKTPIDDNALSQADCSEPKPLDECTDSDEDNNCVLRIASTRCVNLPDEMSTSATRQYSSLTEDAPTADFTTDDNNETSTNPEFVHQHSMARSSSVESGEPLVRTSFMGGRFSWSSVSNADMKQSSTSDESTSKESLSGTTERSGLGDGTAAEAAFRADVSPRKKVQQRKRPESFPSNVNRESLILPEFVVLEEDLVDSSGETNSVNKDAASENQKECLTEVST